MSDSSVFRGEGWYTFEQRGEFGPRWASAPEAVWVEDEADFRDFVEADDGYEAVVTYFGDGDVPSEPVRVAERFIATFTPEQAAAYDELMA